MVYSDFGCGDFNREGVGEHGLVGVCLFVADSVLRGGEVLQCLYRPPRHLLLRAQHFEKLRCWK